MSSYLYDGVLSPDRMRSIYEMLQDYPHPIEMKAVPNLDFLPDHTVAERNTWGGESYTRQTRLYGIVRKYVVMDDSDKTCFLFLYTSDEKQMVLDRCPDLVINADPFKSVISP